MELDGTSESRDKLRSDKERLERELASKNEMVKTHKEVFLTYMYM